MTCDGRRRMQARIWLPRTTKRPWGLGYPLVGARAKTQCNESPHSHTQQSPTSATTDDLFDIILCRYSIFLYSESSQSARSALDLMLARLAPGGILLLGTTDALPQGSGPRKDKVRPRMNNPAPISLCPS